jgi:hypothetical protein
MRYEYKTLQETDVYKFTIEDVNALGAEGWRINTWSLADNGYESILLERVLDN